MPSSIQQHKQANKLLLILQWLLILLLMVALTLLYVSHLRFENKVNERFQGNEQVITRLNEMDDRLFASAQQSLPAPNALVGSQAQNQLDLLRIQIQAVDRLLADSNHNAAIDLLQGLQWQLSQSSNEIAPALTVVIQQSLSEDIARLQAQSQQPSAWQLHNLAIQNIQEFLYSYERIKSDDTLTRQQLTIHEVIMTLNLAIQASNMRDQEQLISHLRQARGQLQPLVTPSQLNNLPSLDNTLSTMPVPSDIPEVILWLDRLVTNAPTPTVLLTTQILNKPER